MNVQMIKLHLRENKEAYIAGRVCLVIGIVGTLVFKSRPTHIINTVAPVISPVFNNSVNFGGHAHKFVKCLETNELWETVTESAKVAGVELSRMSRHLNGHIPNINGLHYEIVGLGTI